MKDKTDLVWEFQEALASDDALNMEPVLLDEDSVPVLPEEDELVVTLLAVEPVPLLESDVAVIVEPDVMLAVALDEEPVPILLVDPVPVPMLLVD